MKLLFIALGLLSLFIGIVGIILPVLPTTPFLLATGVLFSKSSERYSKWFKNTRIYQKYLCNIIENNEMTKTHKWTLLIFTDLLLLLSFISITSLPLRIMIIILTIIKHWYFHLKIETI